MLETLNIEIHHDNIVLILAQLIIEIINYWKRS